MDISEKIKQEKTLVLVKPDGVKRGLIGEVVSRIERRGLKVIAMKMIQVGDEHIKNHLPKSDEWMERLGNKTLKTFSEKVFNTFKKYNESNLYLIAGKALRPLNFKLMLRYVRKYRSLCGNKFSQPI